MNLVHRVDRHTATGAGAPLLIFLHAPKTGGTTLMRIIERRYPRGSVRRLYDSSDGAELASIPSEEIERLSAVGGHFSFGAHEFISRTAMYVTLLRDPVRRVISHYHFVRQRPEHYQFEAANSLSLREFVQACGDAEPNNNQTRLLAGNDRLSGSGICLSEMLPMANEHLRERFAVVGLTEDFDRSLILMRRRLGWNMPWYQSLNVTKNRTPRDEIGPETLKIIQDYNRLDDELYRYAETHFRQAVQREGPSFEREVSVFRALNASYGQFRSRAVSAGGKLWRQAR